MEKKKNKCKEGPSDVMAVKQTDRPRWPFEKSEGPKSRGYCPIYYIDTDDLIECKIVRGIIDKELGERKSRHSEDGEDRVDPNQSTLGYSRLISWSTTYLGVS